MVDRLLSHPAVTSPSPRPGFSVSLKRVPHSLRAPLNRPVVGCIVNRDREGPGIPSRLQRGRPDAGGVLVGLGCNMDESGIVSRRRIKHLGDVASDRLHWSKARIRRWAYVDLDQSIDSTVLVLGSGRSGTTWLMETLNHDNYYRIIFEPFYDNASPGASRFQNTYLDPAGGTAADREILSRTLRGDIRSVWTDQFNRRHIARSRIVKEIRITNLLPWLDANFPTLKVVFLVRHPLAVADSRMAYSALSKDTERARGWWSLDPFIDSLIMHGPMARFAEQVERWQSSNDPMALCIVKWCLENYVPLSTATTNNAHYVFYEQAIRAPEFEFQRIFEYLGRQGAGIDMSKVNNRSALTNRLLPRSNTASSFLKWQARIDERRARELMKILVDFDLGHIYDHRLYPLADEPEAGRADTSG